MDFSRFKTPDWLIIGGAVVFFIGGFLDWVSVEFGGVSASGGNVFDFFFTGIVPWILIIGAAVVTVLLIGGQIKPGTLPWPMIILAATALATLLVLIRFISPAAGEDGLDGVDVGRGIGLILCTLAAIVATVGAVMNFTSKGGNLKDLTDMDKVRGSFGGTQGRGPGMGQTPPPPPPPSSPPPPPPAP